MKRTRTLPRLMLLLMLTAGLTLEPEGLLVGWGIPALATELNEDSSDDVAFETELPEVVVEASWEEDDADYSDEENDGVDMFDDEDTPPEDDEEDGETEEDVYMGQGQYSNDVGKDYIPASDDVLAKEYIQPTGTQIISSCFPATLEYVNHLLGGSINESVYQMQYFYQTSKFIFTSGGISPQEAENLICFNFEVVWYSNVKEAIDEGAVVFSSI